jgi:SAM-dependent methyltransferase
MPKIVPPAELRMRVSNIADAMQFRQSGWQSMVDFRRALAGIGGHIPNAARILEWGCGCGRILIELPVDTERQELHGCDIDGEAIAWLQANYPAFRTIQSEGLPPLPYPDGQFDLILNHSVLTHLDEAYQDAWLAELGRILSPNGTLVLTVHGPFAYRLWIASLPQDRPETAEIKRVSQEALDRDGFYFHVDNVWAADFPSYYQSSFHTPGYIFEHWTRHFDIASYIPRGSLSHQDMILLRHKQR